MTARFPPADVLNALYPSVGELIIHWALFEASLDSWVAIIYRSAKGKELSKRLPRPLDAKKEFLSQCLKEIDVLAKFADEGLALLAESEPLTEIRHTLVHGFLVDYDDASGRLRFHRFNIENDTTGIPIHAAKEARLSIGEILVAGAQCMDLTRRTIEFARQLADVFVK